MLKTRLVNIEINGKDKVKVLLLNTLKMLSNRGIFDKKNIDKVHNNLIKDISEEISYIVDTTKGKYSIKYLDTKISSSYMQRLKPFLEDETNKIIIVSDVNSKIYKQFMEYETSGNVNESSRTVEVFWDYELMIDLAAHDYVPEHSILTEEEEKEFFTQYDIKKKDMPKIKSTDPVARHYNMKPGQIIKILRPSETSGYSIYYRAVIQSSLFNQKS
jgi:DNA-directed RNA polymerase subunit H (RpoH/RPB5)